VAEGTGDSTANRPDPAWSGETRNSGGAPVGRGARLAPLAAGRFGGVRATDGERFKARVITPRSNAKLDDLPHKILSRISSVIAPATT
jgi:hypothetical protein